MSNTTTIFIFIFSVLLSVAFIENSSADSRASLTFLSQEIEISDHNLDLDYSKEDYKNLYTNFCFPKLLQVNGETIVAFPVPQKKLVKFIKVTKDEKKEVLALDNINQTDFGKWPLLITVNNEVYVATFNNQFSSDYKWDSKVNLNKLDLFRGKISHFRTIALSYKDFPNQKRHYISSLIPLSNSFDSWLVTGRYDEKEFHPLAIFSGDFPIYAKNFSASFQANRFEKYYPIEVAGWFSAQQRSYYPTSTGVHSAWIRNSSRPNLSKKHQEVVCYSFLTPNGWSTPLEVVGAESKTAFFKNLSLSANQNEATLIWESNEGNIFCARITHDKPPEIIKLNTIRELTNSSRDVNWIDPLSEARTAKVVISNNGDIYALWATNNKLGHKLYLARIINDVLLETTIINDGFGTVKLPDFVIDQSNFLHITYMKKESDRLGVFYRKISLQK